MSGPALNVHRVGSGPPLVLVHGIGSRWQVFEPLLPILVQRHEVIAVDLPGFGASPHDLAVDGTPSGYAIRLARLFAELGLDRPHVVGSSLGGGVALELARLGAAGRVTAFAPVGFWSAAERRWCQGLLTTMWWASRRARPAASSALRTGVGRAALLAPFFGHPARVGWGTAVADLDALAGAGGFRSARAGFAGYRAPALEPTSTQAAASTPASTGTSAPAPVSVPITVAWGSRDVLLPYRLQAARARRALPHAQHVPLPGCGHLPFSDDPLRCAALVLAAPPRPGDRTTPSPPAARGATEAGPR